MLRLCMGKRIKKIWQNINNWFKSNKLFMKLLLLKIFIIFAIVFILYILWFWHLNQYFENVLLALLSALFGTILVITFLDLYYEYQRKRARNNFLLNLEFKLHSDFLLIIESIEPFLNCDLTSTKTFSIGEDTYFSTEYERVQLIENTIKQIENIINKITDLNEQDIGKLKRFDYYICFIKLMKNININFKHIAEFACLIYQDDDKLKYLFQKIISIKQNLESWNIICENNIPNNKTLQDEEKDKIVLFIDIASNCFLLGLLKSILGNLNELMKLLKDLYGLMVEHNIRLKS